MPGSVLSVDDKQLSDGGWGVGGRTNKGAAPLGLTFSSERQAHIEVLWDRGPQLGWVFSRHICQEHWDTKEHRGGICCVV